MYAKECIKARSAKLFVLALLLADLHNRVFSCRFSKCGFARFANFYQEMSLSFEPLSFFQISPKTGNGPWQPDDLSFYMQEESEKSVWGLEPVRDFRGSPDPAFVPVPATQGEPSHRPESRRRPRTD